MAVDFARVAAALLARSESLCLEWFPAGKRSGHEFKIGDIHGEPGDSLSINLTTGKWADFAADMKGGDLTSLYAAMQGIDQGEAARRLCPEHCNGSAGGPLPRQTEQACEPIPDSNPPPHPDHGEPAAIYRYGSAFLVARYETQNGKTFCPWTYRAGRWTRKAYPALRPLYCLHHLADRPERAVLITEGEKCTDAAHATLSAYACVTWAGGANAVKTADWSVLAGREIIIWPDADGPGAKAAATLGEILLPLVSRLRIVKPDGVELGWDIADAIADGWDDKRIAKWAREHITEPGKPQVGRPHDNKAPVLQLGDSHIVSWQSLGLECNSGGVPFPTIGNVARVLREHPSTAGRIWFDSFRGKIMQTHRGITAAWTDADDLQLLEWIQQHVKLSKVGLQTAQHAVQLAAFCNGKNSVVTWLDALQWDGIERLSEWLSDFLGAPNNSYVQAVARNWIMSMVARAYRPGCQADHMPVLEGASGRGKSSALGIIGGDWYRAAPQAFGSREFLEVIQGAWLVEIPDMVGFGRREHTQIISAITTRSDPYRASYGRHAEDHPRVTIFVATSENDEYLKDSRGVRRYWPVRCADIDLEALAAVREQLFAEAVTGFKAGAHWHDMPADETAAEQAERQESDVWLERIANYCDARDFVTVAEVSLHCLEMEVARQDQQSSNRVARCLKSLGYSCKVERHGARIMRAYRR